MRKKQTITVILEPTAVLYSVEGLVPFKVDWMQYEGRKVLGMEFQAFDCYFTPSRQVAVNAHRNNQVPCFESRHVLEIRKSRAETEKNQFLCPACHHASLKVINNFPAVGTRTHATSCTRKGCNGSSSYTD